MSSAGLCSSHGHCSYDPVDKAPRCYCNQGYGGSDCGSKTSSTSTSYNGLSVQIGLMVTLLLVALGLIGVIGFLSYRIGTFRKSQQYSQLPMSGTEMVERPF